MLDYFIFPLSCMNFLYIFSDDFFYDPFFIFSVFCVLGVFMMLLYIVVFIWCLLNDYVDYYLLLYGVVFILLFQCVFGVWRLGGRQDVCN